MKGPGPKRRKPTLRNAILRIKRLNATVRRLKDENRRLSRKLGDAEDERNSLRARLVTSGDLLLKMRDDAQHYHALAKNAAMAHRLDKEGRL